MKVLHVDSSILGDNSVSRRLSAAVVADWRRRIPGLAVTYRDLANEPLSHFSGPLLMARAGGMAEHELEKDLAVSDCILNEFLEAAVVVIGAPMYNFSISSQLKAWIDRLATPGKTFRYTEEGPEGLAVGKKVIIVSSRGGFYGPGTPMAANDHHEPFLRSVFNFFGISDIEFIRAEGVNVSPELRQKAIDAAERVIAGGVT